MAKMSPKTTAHAAETFRYEPEDLEPRDHSADEAAVDSFIERNKDALNASVEKALVEFERGEYLTLDQVRANLTARRRRLRGSKQ
jgi:hypothetical protein